MAEEVKEQDEQKVFMYEIEANPEEVKYLGNHPRKAAIWLSKKMESGG